jgi:hypothetical protein
MQLSGVADAGRLDADLIGGFAITDSNFGTVMDVSYGTRTTVYSQSLVDITDQLNEAAYGDNFSFGRGVFTYSGLKHSSTSTITNGRNIAVAGSDAIGNHRELPGGLILRSNVYRAATIKLVQSGATARSGGTIFLALRLNGFSQVIDLVIDANAYDNISTNGVIREDLFANDGTVQMDSFDWLYTGSRGNPHGNAALKQGAAGSDNWELGPHYGCYTTRGDRSILKGCRFIGWTGGGCNIQTGGTNFTDEQYGNNIYGHYTLVDGCLYEEPVDVSWNTPYISVVNARYGTTVKNTVVKFPDTEDDFWVLGGGAWASGQTFAFPNHDNTLFENNRAYNCGAMFHRDTLAINGSIMRGNHSYNCGYGILIAMSDADLCQNIVIEDNTFEVRNMNGTTRGTGLG